MEVATEANADQKSRSNSKLVCSSFHPRRLPQNSGILWTLCKACPFLQEAQESNLHWRVILRSQDGSCYKVKIIAVILGEHTQTSNSWYRQMWSTVNSTSGCADASPPQSSFSGPTWGVPPPSMYPVGSLPSR